VLKILMRAISLIHAVMAALFVCAAVLLILMAVHMAWSAVATGISEAGSQTIIEAIGLLAAAVVALQIAQTVAGPAEAEQEMRHLFASLAGE